jgi:hypothetical protein
LVAYDWLRKKLKPGDSLDMRVSPSKAGTATHGTLNATSSKACIRPNIATIPLTKNGQPVARN